MNNNQTDPPKVLRKHRRT